MANRFEAPSSMRLDPSFISKPSHRPSGEHEVLYQIGVPPSRIDIMRSVRGLDLDAAWPNRVMAAFGDVEAPVLGLDDMRAAKKAAGRLKDLADLEELGRPPYDRL